MTQTVQERHADLSFNSQLTSWNKVKPMAEIGPQTGRVRGARSALSSTVPPREVFDLLNTTVWPDR